MCMLNQYNLLRPLGKHRIVVSVGRSFFEFVFTSVEGVQHVCAMVSCSLKHGFLKLFSQTPNFNLKNHKHTKMQWWAFGIFGSFVCVKLRLVVLMVLLVLVTKWWIVVVPLACIDFCTAVVFLWPVLSFLLSWIHLVL
ncbi:transmembrane protein, putative [Medicago truncatula]|uniref:Transmembrane protein, putative n=1 Tax=Medicago truncatula TaxID=3880 RepID=A2Q164_MEDTR|nr:hypothetical protein MtrDRAFT_AC148289g34v2 [Medicago truncatula]AES80365.1 transmembrane protein, putative [Medicago truncatula]